MGNLITKYEDIVIHLHLMNNLIVKYEDIIYLKMEQ